MTITKIEVDSFGKWNNFTLDFSENVNVILGQNEAGKSTICAFLYMMFYGLPSESKKLGIREDWRKRYLPWSGSAMSGTIYFNEGGRSFVLSRKLGKTRRGDKVLLRDASTWEEITDISPDEIGRSFLGIGEEAFLKTLFISQSAAISVSTHEDEILKKLSNLRQSGDEDISYQTVSSAISKAKYELISKNEKAGLLPRLQQKETELEQEVAAVNRLSEQFKNDVLKQASLKQESAELDKEAVDLEEKKKTAKEHERYLAFENTRQERNKLLKRKNENTEKQKARRDRLSDLKKQMESYMTLHTFSRQSVLELSETERLLKGKEVKLKQVSEKKQDLSNLAAEREQEAKKIRLGINIPMIVVAAVVACLGVCFGILLSPVLFLLLPVSILLMVVACLGRKEQKIHKLRLQELDRAIAALHLEIETMDEAALTDEMHQLKQNLKEAFQTAGVGSVQELSQAIEQRQKIQAESEATAKELVLLEETQKQVEADLKQLPEQEPAETFNEKAICFAGESVEKIDALISENHRRQLVNRTALEETTHHINIAFSGTRSTDVILTELADVRDKIEQYEHYYQALCLAEETMEKSYLQLKQDFAPLLNDCVGAVLTELTEGKYSEIKVSDDYKMMLRDKESGEIVSAEYLSSGAYDVLYLALRFGIIRTILPDRHPFLILDDAFLQLDDRRAKLAADFLQKACSGGQVLYFTCHESQVSLFSEDCNKIIL